MKIHLLGFMAIVAAAVALGCFRRPWLPALWLISVLVFPTVQARLVEAPLYLYDVFSIILILCFLASGELSLWPRGTPRWHWWLIGTAFVLSVVGGAIRFGFLPDMVWIWGHASLAWMAFAFGIVVSVSSERSLYRAKMRWAVFSSTVILCGLAIVQSANLPGSSLISSLFYGQMGSEQSVEILRLGAHATRATGPHFAPTGFAGMALLCGLGYWLLCEPGRQWPRWLVLALSAIIVLCTVSRHAIVASLGGLVTFICLSRLRLKAKVLVLGSLASALVCFSLLGLVNTRESWSYRLSKWKEGLFTDDNISTRIVWGPERLAGCLSAHPSLLITGAGLDPEKLSQHAERPLDFESGFVSNGFLLALYYLGLGGFLLYTLFWLWALRVAWRFPAHSQPLMCSFVVTAVLVVAADNYGFMYEPAACLLFLLVGLIAGERHHQALLSWTRSQPAAETESVTLNIKGNACAA